MFVGFVEEWTAPQALILAELRPEHASAILVRGREFGDSRAICGVHYMSDVEAGRLYAAAVVARLHADPQFQADLAASRVELDGSGSDLVAATCGAARPD
jgi:acid phosphatase (class A)